MAIRNREEIINAIRGVVGENTEDNVIQLLEDVSDTLDDYEKRSSGETEWERKYRENDDMWRKKYTERFYGGGAAGQSPDTGQAVTTEETADNPDVAEKEEPTTYDELFYKEG